MKSLTERLSELSPDDCKCVLPNGWYRSADFSALHQVAQEAVEKAELIDFQCVLMTAPELQYWWDSVPIRNEDAQGPEQALENITALYERAKADGVYPIKPKV